MVINIQDCKILGEVLNHLCLVVMLGKEDEWTCYIGKERWVDLFCLSVFYI